MLLLRLHIKLSSSYQISMDLYNVACPYNLDIDCICGTLVLITIVLTTLIFGICADPHFQPQHKTPPRSTHQPATPAPPVLLGRFVAMEKLYTTDAGRM